MMLHNIIADKTHRASLICEECISAAAMSTSDIDSSVSEDGLRSFDFPFAARSNAEGRSSKVLRNEVSP